MIFSTLDSWDGWYLSFEWTTFKICELGDEIKLKNILDQVKNEPNIEIITIKRTDMIKADSCVLKVLKSKPFTRKNIAKQIKSSMTKMATTKEGTQHIRLNWLCEWFLW